MTKMRFSIINIYNSYDLVHDFVDKNRGKLYVKFNKCIYKYCNQKSIKFLINLICLVIYQN